MAQRKRSTRAKPANHSDLRNNALRTSDPNAIGPLSQGYHVGKSEQRDDAMALSLLGSETNLLPVVLSSIEESLASTKSNERSFGIQVLGGLPVTESVCRIIDRALQSERSAELRTQLEHAKHPAEAGS